MCNRRFACLAVFLIGLFSYGTPSKAVTYVVQFEIGTSGFCGIGAGCAEAAAAGFASLGGFDGGGLFVASGPPAPTVLGVGYEITSVSSSLHFADDIGNEISGVAYTDLPDQYFYPADVKIAPPGSPSFDGFVIYGDAGVVTCYGSQNDCTGYSVFGWFDGNIDPSFGGYSLFNVSAVPEPSTWLMLLIGFASLGAAAASRNWGAIKSGAAVRLKLKESVLISLDDAPRREASIRRKEPLWKNQFHQALQTQYPVQPSAQKYFTFDFSEIMVLCCCLVLRRGAFRDRHER